MEEMNHRAGVARLLVSGTGRAGGERARNPAKPLGAAMSDAEGASTAAARDPAEREKARADRSAQCPGDVRAALGPIKALTSESAA